MWCLRWSWCARWRPWRGSSSGCRACPGICGRRMQLGMRLLCRCSPWAARRSPGRREAGATSGRWGLPVRGAIRGVRAPRARRVRRGRPGRSAPPAHREHRALPGRPGLRVSRAVQVRLGLRVIRGRRAPMGKTGRTARTVRRLRAGRTRTARARSTTASRWTVSTRHRRATRARPPHRRPPRIRRRRLKAVWVWRRLLRLPRTVRLEAVVSTESRPVVPCPDPAAADSVTQVAAGVLGPEPVGDPEPPPPPGYDVIETA
jgi:hypothetical protein